MFFLLLLLAATPPPLPLLPIPSSRQMQFHRRNLSMFFHFGVNTFTNSERGTGHEDPAIFQPDLLDAAQWMRVAVSAGASLVILTAKHHDGFCLWPSSYTNFSVSSSPWKGGRGDVVGEFVKAAQEHGLDVGLYLSPWDMHEPSYGKFLEYNEFYLAQLRELLTSYGPISEVWLDGAKGPDAPNMKYLFNTWFSVIHQLQPDANIFSDAGPDIRWVGDENGEANSTCWSMVNSSSITIGQVDGGYLETGDISGTDWVPPECDVSIRPGWFWHKQENAKPLYQLLDIYYKSSGRNCMLLLNVPPNSSGLIDEEDAGILKDFKDTLDSIFSINLARSALVINASSTRTPWDFQPGLVLDGDPATYWAPEAGEFSGWLEFIFEEDVMFNVVEVQEAISMGQRVMEYHVEALVEGEWFRVASGTTVGHRKLDRLEKAVLARAVRLVIPAARADPLVSSFGLYLDNMISAHSSI